MKLKAAGAKGQVFREDLWNPLKEIYVHDAAPPEMQSNFWETQLQFTQVKLQVNSC